MLSVIKGAVFVIVMDIVFSRFLVVSPSLKVNINKNVPTSANFAGGILNLSLSTVI